MTKRVTLLLLLVLTLAVVYSAVRPVVAAERQPHMRAALHHLEAALDELQKAEADKGGHREQAIAATKSAMEHTKQGIAYDNSHEGHEKK